MVTVVKANIASIRRFIRNSF
ncbi:hypothetical protein QLX08_000525 [Tetragonisca angustula]|uniref:Uncharacterized protein n=1 Tax=Tetragonisca angustula TaxID=166442 RepID=A0AAW1AJK3_9HYME